MAHTNIVIIYTKMTFVKIIDENRLKRHLHSVSNTTCSLVASFIIPLLHHAEDLYEPRDAKNFLKNRICSVICNYLVMKISKTCICHIYTYITCH